MQKSQYDDTSQPLTSFRLIEVNILKFLLITIYISVFDIFLFCLKYLKMFRYEEKLFNLKY